MYASASREDATAAAKADGRREDRASETDDATDDGEMDGWRDTTWTQQPEREKRVDVVS